MQCAKDNCTDAFHELVDGVPYCKGHRDEILFDELLGEFDRWDQNTEPPKHFRYLLGRLYEDFKDINDSYLSAARIRHRAFNWKKTPDGCTFEITRHPGAWGTRGVTKKVVQQWRVDIVNREFHLLGDREFSDGDIDR